MAFWYILIHAGLGLVGYELFQFNNLGGLYAAAAAAVVQGYAVWEVYRLAKPKFEESLAEASTVRIRDDLVRAYRKRLWKFYMFRIAAYSMVTLGIAALMRTGA